MSTLKYVPTHKLAILWQNNGLLFSNHYGLNDFKDLIGPFKI